MQTNHLSQKVSHLFTAAQDTLKKFSQEKENIQLVGHLSEQIFQIIERGNKVITCGNGGSMCDAMHFAEELTGKFYKKRNPLPAISICDPSHLTCVANDFGFEAVFSRFIEGIGREGDLLLAFSTSGNSPNLIQALKSAKKKKMQTFCLLGKSGGALAELTNEAIIIKSQSSARIQEIHIKIVHIVIELLESKY